MRCVQPAACVGRHAGECRFAHLGMCRTPVPFVPVMRRLYAAVVVLSLSGLLPLVAAAGLCAAKPCCHPHADAAAASLATNPGCCGTTSNFSAHSTEATSAKTAGVQPQLVDRVGREHVLPVIAVSTRSGIETGSLHTRQRLATLSILLI